MIAPRGILQYYDFHLVLYFSLTSVKIQIIMLYLALVRNISKGTKRSEKKWYETSEIGYETFKGRNVRFRINFLTNIAAVVLQYKLYTYTSFFYNILLCKLILQCRVFFFFFFFFF